MKFSFSFQKHETLDFQKPFFFVFNKLRETFLLLTEIYLQAHVQSVKYSLNIVDSVPVGTRQLFSQFCRAKRSLAHPTIPFSVHVVETRLRSCG